MSLSLSVLMTQLTDRFRRTEPLVQGITPRQLECSVEDVPPYLFSIVMSGKFLGIRGDLFTEIFSGLVPHFIAPGYQRFLNHSVPLRELPAAQCRQYEHHSL